MAKEMMFGRFGKPRDDSRYQWTNHVVGKMRYYQLSEGRVRRVITSPRRIEEGIAPGTIAVMQSGTGKRKEEIWVMFQVVNPAPRNLKHEDCARFRARDSSFKIHATRKRIITAWRYPGVSKPRGPVPVPDDILADLKDLL